MGTSATTSESVGGGKLRPLLSFFAELAEKSIPKSADDRIGITKRIFFSGVVHGLRGEVLDREATFLAAGDMHMVGALVEGEAMGLAISDRLLPWRANNWQKFRDLHTERHPYELHTGLGMALGYLGARDLSLTAALKGGSLFEWFAIDGFAFQQTIQDPLRYVHEQQRPLLRTLPPRANDVLDQGIGRAFWFVFQGNTEKIAHALEKFPTDRRHNLWLGVGVAAAHTAGVSKEELELLTARSGQFRHYLSAGTLVATHVRSRGGTRSAATDRACHTLAGLTSEQAATIVEAAHNSVPGGTTAHADWQTAILARLQAD